jgi:hypothetical protein
MSRRDDITAFNQNALAVTALLRLDFERGTGNQLFDIRSNRLNGVFSVPAADKMHAVCSANLNFFAPRNQPSRHRWLQH